MLFPSESPFEPVDRAFIPATHPQQTVEEITPLPGSAHETLHQFLQGCSWQVHVTDIAELVAHCPDSRTRTQLINQLLDLSILLDTLYGATRIRILGSSYPLETTTDRVMGYYRLAQYCGHPEDSEG